MEKRGHLGIEPKYSKLFIICGKSVTEDDLRENFSIFGNIEYAQVKMDRKTGKSKGLCYVKYYKASAAAEALEEMNGAKVGSESRGIKIVLASDNPDQNKDNREYEPNRVFVRVPKMISLSEIEDEFKEYGRITNINHLKEKGLAFISYTKFKDAAKAVEGCPARYKAAFAEPKPSHPAANQDFSDGGRGGGGMMGSMDGMHGSNGGGGMGYGRDMGGYGMDGGMDGGGMGASFNQPQQGNMNTQQFNTNLSSSMINMIQQNSVVGNSSSCRLKVKFNPAMSKETFMALFNIVPGLVNCDLLDLTNDGAIGVVIYNNAQSAAYAAERLNNLGVPAGSKLQVVVDEVQGGPPDKVADLVNTIQQATQALKEVGYGGLANEVSGSVGRGGASMMGADNMMGGASRGGGAIGGMMGGGMGMGGMGGGMGGNTMMDNGMMGSIPSLMETSGSRSMGGRGDHRGDVRSRLGGGGSGGKDAQDFCSANLPGRAKMLPAATPRLVSLWFLLPDLDTLPDPDIVTDAFCRFGNLIDATCLRGKKCGYANYGSRQSASAAISTLNGCQFMGSRFRVEVADETRSKRKRQKTE